MISKLTARAAMTAKPGRYGDGGGLWLVVSKTGARKWVFRFTFQRKVTEMGLGNGAVPLAEARALATEARKVLASGSNPIEARKQAKQAELQTPTFGKMVDEFLNSREAGWRNEKHKAQWRMTLNRYAAKLSPMPVDQIDTAAIVLVLTPIWSEIPETASRLRGRIEAVLDAARAKGHIGRNEANPARWKGHLETLFPRSRKLVRGHHSAMPYGEVAAFFRELELSPGIAARALRFAILTAARTGEVLGAKWAEIDLERQIWMVPAARMKGGREHRVPLSSTAIELLREQIDARQGAFIFAGPTPEKPLSGMAMSMLLRRKGIDATVHGFRSCFRDWCGETTDFPREVAEAALGHVFGDATERAYRRGDALEKRRALMETWARYVNNKIPHAGEVVLQS